MDMSLFERSHDAPARPDFASRLDFATLVGMLDAASASADPTPVPPEVQAEPEQPALSSLVTVLLGRRGWQAAARALAGRLSAADPASSAAPAVGQQPL